MDVVEKIFSKVSRIPQKPMSQLVFWLGVIISLYLSAQISWKLFPSSEKTVPWQPIISTAKENSNSLISLDSVKDLSLFGRAGEHVAVVKPEPVAEVVTEAPKTSLSIQLTGVVASTAERHGLAVIESRGSQDTYGLGDKIKGTSASLKEVYADRVIITNNGRYETLMLDGLQYTPASEANNHLQQAKIRKIDQRHNETISRDLEYSRDLLLEDPRKINELIAISPVRYNGEISGYRLNPGRDPRLFRTAGFKPNDLAKSINGYDLTDMTQSIEIMSQLPHLSDISVTVERQGQLMEVLFSLPEH